MSLRAIAALLVLLIGILGFQNCTQVKTGGTDSRDLKSNDPGNHGNGDVYSGKTYVRRLASGLCSDGTDIESAIHSLSAEYYLIRSACNDLPSARALDSNLVKVIDADTIAYESLTFSAPPSKRYQVTCTALPSAPVPPGQIAWAQGNLALTQGSDQSFTGFTALDLQITDGWQISTGGVPAVYTSNQNGSLLNLFASQIIMPGRPDKASLQFSVDTTITAQKVLAFVTGGDPIGLFSGFFTLQCDVQSL